MNELLIHEGRLGGVAGLSGAGTPSGTAGVRGDQYTTYSSSSEEEEEEEEKGWAGSQPNPDQSAEESSDEEFTMKVKCTVMYMTSTYIHLTCTSPDSGRVGL